jgi:hypothetical protein
MCCIVRESSSKVTFSSGAIASTAGLYFRYDGILISEIPLLVTGKTCAALCQFLMQRLHSGRTAPQNRYRQETTSFGVLKLISRILIWRGLSDGLDPPSVDERWAWQRPKENFRLATHAIPRTDGMLRRMMPNCKPSIALWLPLPRWAGFDGVHRFKEAQYRLKVALRQAADLLA